jgi:hypothetical protein
MCEKKYYIFFYFGFHAKGFEGVFNHVPVFVLGSWEHVIDESQMVGLWVFVLHVFDWAHWHFQAPLRLKTITTSGIMLNIRLFLVIRIGHLPIPDDLIQRLFKKPKFYFLRRKHTLLG